MINNETVVQALKGVVDPELGRDLVELNLIRDVNIEENHVIIKMTLTTPLCPLVNYLVKQVRDKVSQIDGVGLVDVELVWD